MEGYVLCIGLRGCRGIRNRRSRVGWVCVKAGWSGAAARRGLIWRLEGPASERFWPVETRNLRARRGTGEDRGCGQSFMLRTGLVAGESEAGVGRR